jgi:hypothetical protein
MASGNGNHRSSISVSAVIGAIAMILLLFRPAVLSPSTSPDALGSFRAKISALKQAHKNGDAIEVRISEIELNSALEDFDKHAFDNMYWPPLGTTISLRGNRGDLNAPLRTRGVLLHFRVNVRGRTLYPGPAVVWFAIIPIPAKVVASFVKGFTGNSSAPPWEESQELPNYISSARIENSEVVLETQ